MVATAVLDSAPSRLPAPWDELGGAAALRRPVPATSVRRPGLVRALQRPDAAGVVVLVAPAGYGKTTVLREWADHDRRPFAWVTLDQRHNDAGRLLAAVSRAVDAAVADDEASFVLVLDDVDEIRGAPARRALRAIATDLPPQATLALASRREPPLPLSRMRVEHAVTELGPHELAMTRADAAALLRAAGHELDRDAVGALVQRTEGWPVGLALAAQFLDERGTTVDLGRFGGSDRLVAGYVRDEVLAGMSPEWAAFLVRTSVLDTLTAPACDSLLARSGSATILSGLAASGLLVALDRTDDRFRHHRLIGSALRAELRRGAPGTEPALHRRASAWHRQAGDVDRAVHHALLADDVREAGDLVWSNLPDAVAQGRLTALERWLAGFSTAQIAGEPPLALAAAVRELMMGQGQLVEHWTSAASVAHAAQRRGSTVDVGGALAILRAVVGDGGPERMLADAERAHRAQGDDGPWRSLCCLVAGTAARLLGRDADAATRLEEGTRRAAVSAPQVHALCLAQLAALALERDDWEAAVGFITRARSQVDRYGLGRYGTTAVVFAASAAIRAHRGRVDAARADIDEAMRLQATLTDFAPCYDADVSVLIARAALRLSDPGIAQAQLVRAGRVVARLPEAIGLRHAAAEAQAQLDSFAAEGNAPSVSMTAAELRILRFLPTHLSFREIGERTFVSANTVKTQANAVYRKLDVSCRSDAVARARACGLLDG